MKLQLTNKLSRLVGNTGLQLKKHSPEILMVAGIAGTITSTVMACKATTKATTLLEEAKEEIKAIHTVAEKSDQYTEKDLQQALTMSYAQTGLKLAKLYAPAVIVGTLSITSIVAGHRILKGRNIALAAAYAAVDKGFKSYRKNVVERFGEEMDKELRYNIKAKEIEVETTDENGKKTTKKEIINVAEGNPLDDYSEYARVWENGNPGWSKDPEYNLTFLRQQQNFLNDKLKTQGHLFLNEVYDLLGYPRTKKGQVVGWIYNNKNEFSDGYVDFGIYNINRQANRDFINGYERSIILDFNVDGPILENF